MKVAVVGKGGSGKTTTTGTIARLMARQGLEVIALDCDANPNLGLSLGLSSEETERLVAIRQAVDTEDAEHAPTVPDLLQRFGVLAPDGVRLVVVTKIEQRNPG
jgi:CO dehydrogenase maturation factor